MLLCYKGIRVTRIRLITNRILGEFAGMVHAYRRRLFRIWLVSPWIGHGEDGEDALLLLLDAINSASRCSVVLITRPPQLVWHGRAIELVSATGKATVFSSANLHTKLYIIECDGFRAAVLGSPNLTPRGNRINREMAIELRTTVESTSDDVAAIIFELTEYASSLRGEHGVSLV